MKEHIETYFFLKCTAPPLHFLYGLSQSGPKWLLPQLEHHWGKIDGVSGHFLYGLLQS